MHQMELAVRSSRNGDEAITVLCALQLEGPEAVPDTAVCETALRAVLEHVRAHPWPAAKAPVSWTFALRDRRGEVWDEHALYRIAADAGTMDPLLLDLVAATAAGAHGHRPWADAETPSGTAAITPLALRDRALLPRYLAFLRQCDLDHEVDQAGDLDALAQSHGWAEDTCALVAARLGSCAGQFGEEQVGQWLEEAGLADYLAGQAGQAAMLAAAKAEFGHDGAWARGLVHAAEDSFEGELRFWLGFLEPCLAPAAMDELERHVRALRAAGPSPAAG